MLFLIKFFVLVDLFLLFDMLRMIANIWGIRHVARSLRSPVKKVRDRLLKIFNSAEEGEITSLDLIHLAVRHLKAKKTRTIITIGGMSIGFGSILFLLSLGYGVQKLVVSRVARLDEMKQITVSVGQATSLKLNDETMEHFKEIEKVEAVMPLVSVVSKVNYNNSVSDMVVYGVTRSYLEQSAIKPIKGKLYEDGEEVSFTLPKSITGQVAGAAVEFSTNAKMHKEISQLKYGIYPLVWKTVYAEPSDDSQVLGFTARVVGEQDAVEVWGQPYGAPHDVPKGRDLFNNEYHAWIKDEVPLWSAEDCKEVSVDCVDGKYKVVRDGGKQRFQTGYMMESDLSLERYKIIPETDPTLAEGEVVQRVQFSVPTGSWIQVYSDVFSAEKQDTLFTSKSDSENLYSGELLFGESYSDKEGWGNVGKNENGRPVGLWVRAKVPLWRKVDCSDCENMYLSERDTHDRQIESLAVVRADRVVLENMVSPPQIGGQVLGDATESASLTAEFTSSSSASLDEDITEIDLGDGTFISAQLSDTGELDWVSIASGSADTSSDTRAIIPFTAGSKNEAVVNQAMLNVLGIEESNAINEEFEATFMLDQEFFDEPDYQAQSEPVKLKIIGLIPGDKNPIFYLPFSDIKGMGVENYSQVTVTVTGQNDLNSVRQNIESLGFKTTSVVDTVGKINTLFDTIRFILTILGLVALSVAALGMFNTLTVSLLEKTREVGLMKAIGMKSSEVKRLFFAESIVMGLSGGIFGIIISFIAGHVLSIFLSTFSLTKGLGYINLVHTPFYLLIGIMTVSFIVGVLTGLYPSHRATKISALNALRYE